MRPFEFLEPANLAEACQLISRYKDRAKLIAGGQSLLPILKQRMISPEYLISIKNLHELEYIKQNSSGIEIGALTTHHAIEISPLIKEKFPILAEMENSLGSIQIRNWGTIGGNLCHADPAGDPGVVLLALKASVMTNSIRGNREIPLDSFFVSYMETALEPDEILTEIHIPYPVPHTGFSYVKESVRFGERPIASAAAAISIKGKNIKEARIYLGAAGNTPKRAVKAEKYYNTGAGKFPEAASQAASDEAEPGSDLEGTKEYKKQIIKVIVKRALSQAIAQAQAGSTGDTR